MVKFLQKTTADSGRAAFSAHSQITLAHESIYVDKLRKTFFRSEGQVSWVYLEC